MRAWLLQRLSAFYLGVVILIVSVWWLTTDSITYVEWRQLIGHPFIAVMLALFFLALLFHAWVGIRDIMLDYIHHIGIRLVLLLSIAGVLLAMAVWTTFIILSVVYI
jgi:succinate dehydrogenase / fumarate reductase membrane anchor subunit